MHVKYSKLSKLVNKVELPTKELFASRVGVFNPGALQKSMS